MSHSHKIGWAWGGWVWVVSGGEHERISLEPPLSRIHRPEPLGSFATEIHMENSTRRRPQTTYPLLSAHRVPIAVHEITQMARFVGPTWGPPGSCRPQMGSMLAPWTLLSGKPQARTLALRGWDRAACHNECTSHKIVTIGKNNDFHSTMCFYQLYVTI